MTDARVADIADTMEADLQAWPPSADTIRCPFPLFAALRASEPVRKFDQPNPLGRAMYLVTGHAECVHILSRHKEFGSDLAGALPGFDKSAVPLPFPDVESFHERSVVFFAGGDDHRVKRKWSIELISRSRIEGWKPAIAAEVDRLIDSFAQGGSLDWRTRFCNLLPIQVLRLILDLPADAEQTIRDMVMAIAATDVDPNITPEQAAEKAQALGRLFAMNRQILEERRAYPGDDYVSHLVKLQVEQDGALDVNALSIHLQGLMLGGDHAVGAHLAYVLAELAQRPDMQQELRADPAKALHFVHETLRIDPPLPWLFRLCEVDTTVGGVDIPAGSVMVVAISSANRDAAVFPDPDHFSVDRSNLSREFMSMGRGSHRCVGEPLAVAVAGVVIERMLDRFSTIALDTERSDLDPEPSFQFRCPKSVHLILEPRT